MSVITVKNLTFKYPQNNKAALSDVSFGIEKGSYVAIVGYNGCGKSTLARLLCGLEVPASGTIQIEENNRIGIVFQSPKDQLVSGIVSRDTAFGAQNLGLTAGEVELRVIESLNIVDMLDRASSSTSALSLGQTQKIALSGVLALRPEILILDEAVSMIDPEARKEILEFLRYWHKCGNTIIQITHDLEVLADADSVIGIEEGRVFFYGTQKAFLEDAENVSRICGQPLPKRKELECESAVVSIHPAGTQPPQQTPLTENTSPVVECDAQLKCESPVVECDAERRVSKPPAEITLQLKDLTYVHDEEHGIFNINLNFYKGSLTALTGPSGAGKSTLLEICAGLIMPQEGSLYCEGGSRPALAQQNAQAALFEPFAADDVAFGPRNQGVTGKALIERVSASMDEAALPFELFGERRTFELSGGEQRRLSIAGILALNSAIVLFDEPTAGLDSRARNEVMALLRRLASEGKTVIFSTHKRDEADFADREIVIKEGRVVSDTMPAAVVSIRPAGTQPPQQPTQAENTSPVVECDAGHEFEAPVVSIRPAGTQPPQQTPQTENTSPVVECDAQRRVSKPQLSKLRPSEAAAMIAGLKKLSAGLSRSRRKKRAPLEALPPAVRILLFTALFVFSLVVRPLWLCVAALLAGAVYCLLCGFSLRRLFSASLKILPFLLLFSLFQMIFHPAVEGEVHFTQWRWFMVTPSKLLFCLAAILRTDASLACISGFFVSTPEYDLMDGLNILLTPLRLCRIPVRYLILIIEIIFRFIPLLVDEAISILKTQAIRGGLGNVKGKLAKIRSVLPLIVPLIIQSIKRSEALADAITMRCFK